jgi:energy-coupling factor transport system permease protein
VWSSSEHEFNAGAWLLWLAVAMLAALLTRNPYYLTLVIASALTVHVWLNKISGPSSVLRPSSSVLLRAVLGLLVIVTLFKGLSLHLGTTILFRLPDEWPVIGGPITLEAMVSAGLDALSLLAVLAVFSAFSAGADYYALLKSVPPFMHQVGLVTSIAVTFVPQTVTRFSEIREAQTLRGHRVRRIGDLVPIVMPLLAGGMERSLNLAEAMEARGFSRASGAQTVAPIVVQTGLAFGLGLVLVGGAMLAFLPALPWVGWLAILGGLLSISLTLRAVGRGVKRTHYRHSVWRERDTVLAAIALSIGAILLTYRWVAPSTLVYDPLAPLRIYSPPFDPVLALSILALATPALIATRSNREAA